MASVVAEDEIFGCVDYSGLWCVWAHAAMLAGIRPYTHLLSCVLARVVRLLERDDVPSQCG